MAQLTCCPKDCPRRSPTCHSTCGDYIVDAAFNAVKRDEHTKQVEAEYIDKRNRYKNMCRESGTGNKQFQTAFSRQSQRRWGR